MNCHVKKPCLVGQNIFVIMDKFVTFMGYLQNVVMPSRRNQSGESASASSETRNHAKNEACRLPQVKSHPRAEQNIRKGSSGRRFDSKAGRSTGGDMKEEDGSSERNGVFLHSEVEEARTPRPKCKRFVKNEQPKRFGNVKIDNCRSQDDTVSNSCSGAGSNIGQTSATSPEKLSQSVKKQTSLPSYSAARGLPHDQMKQQKTKEDNRGKKDFQGRNGLPDIHSTDGKPLVQFRQTSFPNVPIRSIATPVLVSDTLSFDHVGDDWMCPQKDQNSRLKLPKLKKKKKKKKRKDFGNSQFVGQSEQGGMPGEKESKLSAGDVKEVENLSKERNINGGGEGNVINGREHRQQRPRTALGKWLKKRSNSVAPAPFDDVISDARDDGSKHVSQLTRNLVTKPLPRAFGSKMIFRETYFSHAIYTDTFTPFAEENDQSKFQDK